MPRWPSQPPVDSVAKRARKNAVKETTNVVSLPDPHHSVVEALSTAEAVPLSVREMLCAGLDGCLASINAKGGKAIARHPFQDQILGAVVDALETAEATMKNEVVEAEDALEASQAEMASCECARQALEFGLAESSQNIEGQEQALEDNAEALENTRHALGVAEAALRRTDTEIGEAAMCRHEILQVLHFATSMSEKGAPDGECAKYLEESRHLIKPCAERAAKHATSALQDLSVEESVEEPTAVKESVHEDATVDQAASGKPDAEQSSALNDSSVEKSIKEPDDAASVQEDGNPSGKPDVEQSVSTQNLVSEQPACDQSEEQVRDEQPASKQLAEQLSRFSNCTTELESIVSQTAAARTLRVAEVDAAQAECSTMLSKRSEQSSELREAKQVHRRREASLKSNEKDMKRIRAKCEACIESSDSAQERLKELQQGPLSKCRRVAGTSVKVLASDSIEFVPKHELKCMHALGDVEMRVELVGAGC